MTWSLSRPGRVLLAVLSAGAGVIHLVMVRSHADEWVLEGVAFGVVGALQLAVAVQLLWRPSERVLRAACWANVGLVAAWVVSRIWGLPVGPEAGHPHDASFVDVTCVLLETAFVLVGYELLVRPERGAGLRRPSLAALALVPLAVVGVTVAAVTSPSVADHAHDAHDHSDDTEHAHAEGEPHDHAAAEVAFLFPDGDDGGWADVQNGEEHGPHQAQVPMEDLAPRVRGELQRQLALTMVPTMAYPTVADAEAAGYHRTGSFNPGLGVHYTGGMSDLDGVLSDEEITHPSTITYAGTEPDSPITGFMYNSNSFGGDADAGPEGFAGPNDQWHTHSGICIKFMPNGEMNVFGEDDGVEGREDCEAREAQFMEDIQTSLLHVWTVPAYTNPLGVFAHANPALPCADGTYVTTHACQQR